jgi:hypothetical protein
MGTGGEVGHLRESAVVVAGGWAITNRVTPAPVTGQRCEEVS